jgi:hypothetical protein
VVWVDVMVSANQPENSSLSDSVSKSAALTPVSIYQQSRQPEVDSDDELIDL